jgi:nondiscriminating aspartyl-tRNA synthetase
MERILVKECLEKIGEKVRLAGWVDTIRDHGKISFLDLRDRTGLVQCVGQNLPKVSPESVIEITGSVSKRPENLVNANLKTGEIEVQIEKLSVISPANELPIDLGKEDLDLELPTLLDLRSLTLRHPKVNAIFKVQAVVVDAFREALKLKDFVEFQAPSIISSVPEGGAEVFKLQYFDHEAYLSQSPQLYKSLLVGAYERVFSVNQIFRAEPSVTTRHLTEATSLDAEFGFIDSWREVLEMQEYVIKYIFSEVAKRCSEELELFNATLPMVSDPIPSIKLREAQQIIFERTGRDVKAEKDLAPEDEREICAWAKETKNSELIFITHFLTANKPFYVYPDPEDPTYAFSVDLLGRGVEWSSGGQRLNDYSTILEHVKKWGLKPEEIELYLQSFRFAVPPLGGFALGAERMTMHILGLKNIREASIFPRDMERIDIRLSTIQPKSVAFEGGDVYEKILGALGKREISFEKYEHDPVYTSEQAAKIRGTSIGQGAKALVLQADKDFVLYVLPADLQADLEKLQEKLEVKKLRMASKDSVKAKTGLEVGAVPPLGSFVGLKTYVDKRLSEIPEIVFNAGRHDRSIRIKYSDYLKLENPVVVSL